ncbi:hypothetical protein C7N83_05075 [Neisseria iguanae]|uniref:Polyvalent protein metallopeptidase domain-containing protein n=1 Tax=Neisseria iguanae TaxID=90242 RepID=A0A2P7U139_9NEIS|nr:hypothetical protein C7N83_05075 [Neisseria iguanae]
MRAEISSLMLTRELGLPHNPDRHAAYAGSWIKVLQEDPTEIMKASRDAQKIKNFVLAFGQAIDKQQEKETAPDTAKQNQDELKHALIKGLYDKQTETLTPKEQQQRKLLEQTLETAVQGLSPEYQQAARTRFYEDQIKQVAQAQNQKPAPEQSELFFGR